MAIINYQNKKHYIKLSAIVLNMLDTLCDY